MKFNQISTVYLSHCWIQIKTENGCVTESEQNIYYMYSPLSIDWSRYDMLKNFRMYSLSLSHSSATFQYHLWIWIFTSLFEEKKIDRSKASTSCIHNTHVCEFFSVWNSAFQFNLVSYKYWTGTYVECFHILKFDLVVFDAPEMAISDKMFETCMCKHLRISWIMAMT